MKNSSTGGLIGIPDPAALGSAEEIASGAGFVVGHALVIDGGYLAQ